jgi:hypothetical protein
LTHVHLKREKFEMTESKTEVSENVKKQLEADRKASDKSKSEYAARSKGKPTPTQEENDIVALGGHILEHEADGSDPDPNVVAHNKSMETSSSAHKPQQSYQNRQSTTKHE